MKVLANCIIILLLSVTNSFGQGRPLQRIHAAKMAYMADRMQLSEAQASKFGPIYRDYEKDLRDIRQPYIKKYKLGKTGEEAATARQYVENDLDYQQQVIEVKRKYNDRFLKVLSQRQLGDMYIAEREFRQMLMKRLNQRKGRKGGR